MPSLSLARRSESDGAYPPVRTAAEAPTAAAPGLSAKPARDRAPIGVAAMLLSTLLFPLSDMLSKVLTGTYAGLEVTWMRFVVLLVMMVPMLVRRPSLLCTTRPAVQLARGVFSTAATSLALVGFVFLPVANATAIGFFAPVLVTALAALVLKERVGRQRWLAALVGFGGILVIVQPGGSTFQLATLLPLASSLFSAGTVIATRLGRAERVETTVLWSALVGFVVTSIAVAFCWTGIDAHGALLGLAMGLLAAAASVLQVVAYRCAPASLIAPFSYAQILWAMGIGWLTFGTVPSAAMLAGSAIVIAGGCCAARQQRGPGSAPARDWRRLRRDLMRLHPASRAAA